MNDEDREALKSGLRCTIVMGSAPHQFYCARGTIATVALTCGQGHSNKQNVCSFHVQRFAEADPKDPMTCFWCAQVGDYSPVSGRVIEPEGTAGGDPLWDWTLLP